MSGRHGVPKTNERQLNMQDFTSQDNAGSEVGATRRGAAGYGPGLLAPLQLQDMCTLQSFGSNVACLPCMLDLRA